MKWQDIPLAELANVRSGGGAPQNSDAFSDDGLPFVRAGSLVKLLSGTKEADLEKIRPEVARAHGLKPFPAGTVLFAKSGMSATKGHIYALRREAYVVNHLAALVPHQPTDSAFLTQVLQFFSPTALIKDPAYPSIRLGDIEEMTVRAPRDSHERERIAGILDQADALRQKRREALARQTTMAQAIFIDMFGDPATNPRAWPTEKLGNVGDLERGVSKHRPRNDPDLLGGPYPLIQTGDVANSNGYITEYNSTYSEKGLKQSRMWPKGTLCITIAANIGNTAILGFDACFPDSVVGFVPSDLVTIEYVHYWMGFIQKKLEDEAPQSAQKNINLAILRNLSICLPPIELQISYGRAIRALDVIKEKTQQHMAELNFLFAALQHRAFRGEL